ncbi:peptide methionine sulfoxide reductase [Copidosoma floridanum]|uniref:peptide methionine sulfoxide reductase n=1 Tax=Copidosoma floridanum TaxID=29053 RepID=UPI000C6F609F|nr:peptide methionine sulfoxide reductase [Copidosoma floridanum]XP_023246568.1 peptide methionine sulfoxide reductase [Copidosoma floridanum]
MPGQVDSVEGKRATFGMGCFWASDSLFGATLGVIRTSVGYAGGTSNTPTYKNIGDHTEVVDIEYNPEVVSYTQLLDLFWNNHEYSLTSRTKRQYMSLILYHDEEQRITAEKSRDRQQHEKNEKFSTEIRAFERFYPAEDYHQKYRLQGHAWLMEAIGVKSGEQLRTSPLAAKLNGYLAGVVTAVEYERQVPGLGLSDKAAQYVRKHVVERQGNGLYC